MHSLYATIVNCESPYLITLTLNNRWSLCNFYHPIITKYLCLLSLWYICSWSLSLYIWAILPPSVSDARWRRGRETKRLMKQLIKLCERKKYIRKSNLLKCPFQRVMVAYCISLKFLEKKKMRKLLEDKIVNDLERCPVWKNRGYHLLPSVYVTTW